MCSCMAPSEPPQRDKALARAHAASAVRWTGGAVIGLRRWYGVHSTVRHSDIECGPNGDSSPNPDTKPNTVQVSCAQPVIDFLTKLEELDSRLSVGLNFQEYGTQVGDVKVAYDRIDFTGTDPLCFSLVGVPAEAALNDYISAYNTWNACVSNISCTNASIKSKLKAKWA